MKIGEICNLATLNPNLKTRISPNVFLEVQFLFFWHFNNFYLYFTRIYNCVTGSDGLQSLFHVEMNIRNSKIAARMLYENNFMQLHNKNVKINV